MLAAILAAVLIVSVAATAQERNGPAKFETGVKVFKAGDYKRAIVIFSAIVKRRPENAKALAMRSRAYSVTKSPELALHDAQAALKADPKEPLAHFAKGIIDQDKKKPDQVLKAY
ncbi:MAG: tetratricopeptide repeat protein [Rhodospirillales bacterium]|nr:tetratricopeptide repeat protein [Rhodospirillales bacterium]